LAGVTTHVLDTTIGRPAAGMAIEFSILSGDGTWRLLKNERTNADGRTAAPLLSGPETLIGSYRLVFGVADYFRSRGVNLPDPPFLDRVPIRFGIADAGTHYHIPLICTPWTYSTYRGS
jgi:hydroxyisourate hydrolase